MDQDEREHRAKVVTLALQGNFSHQTILVMGKSEDDRSGCLRSKTPTSLPLPPLAANLVRHFLDLRHV
jgi:hypothetical protein